ncbi:MAG: hypothetical protein H6766_02250 [Candidatus Peribacteria bacterium]|nr:MAG: hypothetical protein H6766_02250 [Candidatus Peribacteria bacterium]
MIEDIADMLYAKALEKHISFITTHAYSHDYISPTGQSDHEYLKKIEKEAEKNNVKAYFIHLIADDNSILNRIINPSRKEYLKLTDQEIMKELLQQHDRKTSADVRNNLTIDTTHLTAEETAEQILNFIQ